MGSSPAPADTTPPTQPHQPRLAGLDALRGLAAVVVLLYHFTDRYHALFRFPADVPPLVPGGPQAVALFFIISGFVIPLTAGRAAGAADFLRARAVRLYPAYWACLLVTVGAVRALGLPGHESSWPRVAVNLTMFQQFVGVGW